MKTATPTVVKNTASQADEAPALPATDPGHSPEPWVAYLQYGYVNDANGEAIADFWSRSIFSSKANRRRAIAAVNACAGIPIEALEHGAVDDLRFALEKCEPHLRRLSNYDGDSESRPSLQLANNVRDLLARVRS